MSRKEPFPYSHYVMKTRKEHRCELCRKMIPKGVQARYKNLFTGEKGYIHSIPDCEQAALREGKRRIE